MFVRRRSGMVSGSRASFVCVVVALFVLFSSGRASAEEVASITLTKEMLADGYAPLGRQWRFRAGDDPAWASPELDDSGWSLVDPRLAGAGQVPEGFDGVGWYRVRVSLDEGVEPQRFAFRIQSWLRWEMHLDGKRVVSFEERPPGDGFDPPHPRELFLGDRESHVLAFKITSADWEAVRDGGFPLGVAVYVAPTLGWAAVRAHRGSFVHTAANGVFTGAAWALGILHLLMFFWYREERKNLYFAALAMSFASLHSTGLFAMPFVYELASVKPVVLYTTAVFGWFSIFAVLTFRALLHEDTPTVTRALWIVGGVWTLATPFIGDFRYGFGMMLLAVVECTRLVIKGLLRRSPAARQIALGGLLFVGSILVAVAVEIGDAFQADGTPIAPGVGVSALLLSISVSIAREFSAAKRAEAERALLRARQAELVHAEKMAALGGMVAGIAHEMNTPLGAVRSAGDSLATANQRLHKWLDKNAPDAREDRRLTKLLEVTQDSTDIVEAATQRLSDVVQRLRSFAKLDEAEQQRSDVNQSVTTSLSMLSHDLEHVAVVSELGEVPELTCVPRHINQVITHVVTNAVQAEAKSITIRTREEGGHAVIEVEDDGHGIPDDVLPKVFDPGFTTHGVGLGGGLGLAISHQIVSDHGGSIDVVSSDRTVVSIRLPLDGSAAG